VYTNKSALESRDFSASNQKFDTMSDIEERPSKIRKLESLDPSQSPRDSSEVPNIPDTHHLNPDGVLETEEQRPLSKNQLKRLRKQQEWEAGKGDRRLKRREKHKEKQARKAERRNEIQEKIANGELDPAAAVPKKEARKGPSRPIPVPVTLIMDCDFNELMTEKEIISMGAQLTRCYSDNRTNPYRANLAISSWSGTLKTRFETVLANTHHGWKGVRFTEKDFVGAAEDLDEVMKGPNGGKLVGALAGEGEGTAGTKGTVPSTEAPPESDVESAIPGSDIPNTKDVLEKDTAPTSKPSIVYLTSDSPNTLDRLQPNTSYIIGGIVDKNRHKGICYKRACERGIATARLPIGEYMTMQSRSVLTINHVVEIMLKWLVTGDWGESFLSVIPKRKEARLRVKEEAESSGDDEDDESGGVTLAETRNTSERLE
jgi:tRNA (guanine9-N1)-methyltransferase